MKCVNCSKPVNENNSKDMLMFGWRICKQCENYGKQLDKEINQGITLKYADGTSEKLTSK